MAKIDDDVHAIDKRVSIIENSVETKFSYIAIALDDLNKKVDNGNSLNKDDHCNIIKIITDLEKRMLLTEERTSYNEKKISDAQGQIAIVANDISSWKAWLIKWLLGSTLSAGGAAYAVIRILT